MSKKNKKGLVEESSPLWAGSICRLHLIRCGVDGVPMFVLKKVPPTTTLDHFTVRDDEKQIDYEVDGLVLGVMEARGLAAVLLEFARDK